VCECDNTLSKNIKCSKRKYSERNKELNDVNNVEISYSILEMDLDQRELCELGELLGVRPHVKEVMNDVVKKNRL
jgi:hypothetical protein